MRGTVRDKLSEAPDRLRRSGVESPQLDAEILLATAIGRTRLDVIAHPEIELSEAQEHAFSRMLDRREQRCPLAYIIGYREFYGISVAVSQGVLVPRPETELLVDEVRRRLGSGPVHIGEVGVGSGAVVVALGANLPEAQLYGTEISPAALEVARRNVAKQHLTDRVTLFEGNLLEPLAGLGITFDAIVSNPPYVRTDEIPNLQPEISRWEPREALDGGPDGLDVIRVLLPTARGLLKASGLVVVELGMGQADAVGRIAEAAGYLHVDVVRDLAGIERVVVCQR